MEAIERDVNPQRLTSASESLHKRSGYVAPNDRSERKIAGLSGDPTRYQSSAFAVAVGNSRTTQCAASRALRWRSKMRLNSEDVISYCSSRYPDRFIQQLRRFKRPLACARSHVGHSRHMLQRSYRASARAVVKSGTPARAICCGVRRPTWTYRRCRHNLYALPSMIERVIVPMRRPKIVEIGHRSRNRWHIPG